MVACEDWFILWQGSFTFRVARSPPQPVRRLRHSLHGPPPRPAPRGAHLAEHRALNRPSPPRRSRTARTSRFTHCQLSNPLGTDPGHPAKDAKGDANLRGVPESFTMAVEEKVGARARGHHPPFLDDVQCSPCPLSVCSGRCSCSRFPCLAQRDATSDETKTTTSKPGPTATVLSRTTPRRLYPRVSPRRSRVRSYSRAASRGLTCVTRS
jgi:hypothetical protein